MSSNIGPANKLAPPNPHWRTGSIFRDFSAFGVEQNPPPGSTRSDKKMITMLVLIKEYTMVGYIMVWPATHAHEPISERSRDGASTRPGPSLFPLRCYLTISLTLLTTLE